MNQNRKNDIIFLVKYLSKLIDKDFDNRLSEYDLTGQQGRILFFVACKTDIEHLEVHQNDIENEYHLSKSTVSGIVKRMNKKNLISIEKQHPYAILRPTDEGRKIIHQLRENRNIAVKRLLKGLDNEQREILNKDLNKLIENMEGGK